MFTANLNSNTLQNIPSSIYRYPANVVNQQFQWIAEAASLPTSTLFRSLLFSKKIQDSIAFLNKFATGDSRDYLYELGAVASTSANLFIRDHELGSLSRASA